MWGEGERVRDEKTGKAGTVVQVTGPAPFIYRVMLEAAAGDGAPPIMIYRYGHQLRGAPVRVPRSRGESPRGRGRPTRR
ncbi:hypothetical protein DTL70_07840 [Streptomyces diacarni]|uniref:DUF1918 domain-containing protein n=1 Tax=Streptomyces diacarni TaxID=2800381 RepID=A0A367F6J6_9ACTN|nr:hypothetical protein DTL70_07840 [Streptomyces diacarni]